jgi:hypothetical protein
MFPVIEQGPLCAALIAQPVVFHLPLLLPRPDKRRCSRFARLSQSLGLDQKQFSFPELKEGSATLWIGALAEHVFTASDFIKNESHRADGFNVLCTCDARSLLKELQGLRKFKVNSGRRFLTAFAD